MSDVTTENLKPTFSEGGEGEEEDVKLYMIVQRLITVIFSSDSTPLLQRIKYYLSHNLPLIPQASTNTARHLLLWTRRGGPLRSLLVLSVGTIALLSLTGFLVFMLFFIAATVNAILISLLMSLAAAGGFLAIFFACVAAIYIGALAVAVFVISTMTILSTIAVLIAAGWIGFFWTVWFATTKSVGLAKHSLGMSRSALSAYSSARQRHEPNKVLD